jgi:hypothetical protein
MYLTGVAGSGGGKETWQLGGDMANYSGKRKEITGSQREEHGAMKETLPTL